MLYKSKIFYFFIFTILFISACNVEKEKEVPSNIVDEKTFINILADIHIAESSVEKMSLKNVEEIISHKKTFFTNVVNHYGLSQEDFNDNYDFYSKDVEKFTEIYDEVLETLSIEEALVEKKSNPIEKE